MRGGGERERKRERDREGVEREGRRLVLTLRITGNADPY